MNLCRHEEASQLGVGDTVTEVRVEPVIQGSLALSESKGLRSRVSQLLSELLLDDLAVLGHKGANLLELAGVFPH